jgi:hypothetical protein
METDKLKDFTTQELVDAIIARDKLAVCLFLKDDGKTMGMATNTGSMEAMQIFMFRALSLTGCDLTNLFDDDGD